MKHTIIVLLLLLSVAAQAAELPWLRTDGPKIVDERGQSVQLTGFNLGGWLVEEMWMMGYVTKPPAGNAAPEIKDHVTLWKAVEARLGTAEMRRVRAAQREAWLGEADIKRIAEAGFNCVRLPFTYDLLEEPGGWDYIDRALQWAKNSGIYVIIDLHGAPGRQSKDHHSGQAGVNKLFTSAALVEETAAWWTKIAARYKDRSEVAGYDLLNEPMGAPDAATLHIVHDRLYKAVRAVDARHIVFIEDAYKGAETFPYPAAVGWQNVVLSIHSYRFDAKKPQDQLDSLKSLASARRESRKRGAPYFLGEFGFEPQGRTVAAEYLRTIQEDGWSWSYWTYKTAPSWSGSWWGWFVAKPGLKPLDPFRDSAEEMIAKVAQFKTENLQENPELKQAMQAALKAPSWQETIVSGWRWKTAAAGETVPPMATNGEGWSDFVPDSDVFSSKAGAAWFRATLPQIVGARRVLRFDAVDDTATVYLNGQKLLRHEGWNDTFDVPLDAAWKAGGPNEIAVFVENGNQGGGLRGDTTLRATAK